MIYNLVEYLKTNLPALSFIANGFSSDAPIDCLAVSETGGEPIHWYPRTNWTMQILSRAQNAVKSKKQVDQVYQLLKNKFGVILPAVTVDGTLYPAVTTYQISPIQTPGYLGASDVHGEIFSFNITIVTT